MSVIHDVEVLIVGAGPTGLALACHLLRLGVNVRIVDSKSGPAETSRAIGLQYRVSEVLACMGIVDRFIERGAEPKTVAMYAGGRMLAGVRFTGFEGSAGRDAFVPRVIMLPQSDTEEILADVVGERGGRIEWNTTFVDFEQQPGAVMTRLRHADGREERVASAYLVSCEGAHSAIRKQAGLSFEGKTYPLAFFMADVDVAGPLDKQEVHVWFHPEGSFAAMPLPTRPRLFRLMVEVTHQLGQLPKVITLDVIRDLMARRVPGLALEISNPTWISEFRVHCRMVNRYRAGRVLLAGDAAHIHSPNGGQGIVTGLQDATNLAWKLARVLQGAPDELLDSYEEERLPKARDVLKETDKVTTKLFTAHTFMARALRDYFILPLLRSDWVQKKMFVKLAQLHVNYRGQRLSAHQDKNRWLGRARLKAGDRAPDVVFRRGTSGERVTLFELLQPMRPVVLIGDTPNRDRERMAQLRQALAALDIDSYLVAPAESRNCESSECLVDEHGDFKRLYGLNVDFLCLVRPDDHLGLVQRPLNESLLREYLRLLCGSAAVDEAFAGGEQMTLWGQVAG